MNSEPPIRVSIVEDDKCVRDSLAALIEGVPGFTCTHTYPHGLAAAGGIPKDPPDVVLMDINLPRMNGIECTRQLKDLLPRLQIIMLTVYEDDEKVFEALRAGACGYLLKNTPHLKILEALADAHKGGSPMSGYIARKVVQTFQQPAAGPTSTGTEYALSPREKEILQYLTRGYRYKEIADVLSLSIETVRTHIRRIYDKLHVRSRTEAVVLYMNK